MADPRRHQPSTMDQREIGVIGLGLLGGAIAQRLMTARFSVSGYDIDSARCQAFTDAGGRRTSNAAEVSRACHRLLLSLPTSDVVEQVLDEIADDLRPGAIVIDTTTGDPGKSAELGAKLSGRRVEYLDATVSGSSAEALEGNVLVMAGGRQHAFDACHDVFTCFARRWYLVGAWGAGAKMKLATNLVLGLNRAALAEGLAFAKAVGLAPEVALTIFADSAAYSRVMDTKGRKMITGDFTPQARLSQHLKDVRLILTQGAQAGLKLPLSTLHRQLLQRLVDAGLGEVDNSAVIRAFENTVGGSY